MQVGLVVKRPNHQECFARDEGRKEWRGAYTRQWLMRRPFRRGWLPKEPNLPLPLRPDESRAQRQSTRKLTPTGGSSAIRVQARGEESSSSWPDSNPARLRSLCIFVR